MTLEKGIKGRHFSADSETRSNDDGFLSVGIDQDRRRQLTSDVDSDTSVATADFFLESARDAEREQQAILETVSVDATYQDTLTEYIETKHEQVERIEDNLERLIERQQSRIQQNKSNQPGFFAFPNIKKQWQSQQSMQLDRLQSLRSRLEMVREISNETGIHGPRIEEFAERKLRADHPELAKDFDELCAAQRHQEAIRAKERKMAQSNSTGRGLSIGLSNRH